VFTVAWTQLLAIGPNTARIETVLDPSKRPDAEILGALPVFPLPNVVLLPGMLLPLNVFEPRYLALVDHVLERGESGLGRWLAIPTLQPTMDPQGSMAASAPIYPVMGLGEMVAHQALPDGRRLIRVVGVGRVRAVQELALLDGFRRLAVEVLEEPGPDDTHAFAVLRAQVERMVQAFPDSDRRLIEAVLDIDDERIVSYALASLIPSVEAIEGIEGVGHEPALTTQARLQQHCLETVSCDERVDVLLARLAKVMDRLGSRARSASLN
jgi:Lon protease-like protein